MSDQIVTNKQMSVLDLSPLRDTADVALVLQPRGTEGATRIVSAETAESEVLQRVKKAGWVDVTSANAAAPAPGKTAVPPPPEPAPEPAPVAAVPEPEPEPAPVAAVPEPEPVDVVETPREIAPEPAPTPSKRRRS